MLKIGHRGAAAHFLENSMSGFQFALEQNFDGIEIDVQFTRDNIPIVMHDNSLGRTSNGNGLISDVTYDDLMRDVKLRNDEKIPSLEEVVMLIANTNKLLYMELKDTRGLDKVLQLSDQFLNKRNMIISSFHHSLIKEVKKRNSEYKTMALFECDPIDPISLVKNAGADEAGLGLSTISEKMISTLQNAGIKCLSWTVKNQIDFDYASQSGIEGVFSDILLP